MPTPRATTTACTHPDARVVGLRLRASGTLDSEFAPGIHGAALIMGNHLARSVRGIPCAPPSPVSC